jgi:hypothetical protein
MPMMIADRCREETGYKNPDDNIHIRENRCQLVTRVGTDTHEAARAKRDQARITGQVFRPSAASAKMRVGIMIVLSQKSSAMNGTIRT